MKRALAFVLGILFIGCFIVALVFVKSMILSIILCIIFIVIAGLLFRYSFSRYE